MVEGERIIDIVVHFNGSWRISRTTEEKKYVGGSVETRQCDVDFMGYFDLVHLVSQLVQWNSNQFLSLFWERKIKGKPTEYIPIVVDKDVMEMLEMIKDKNSVHIYSILEEFEIPGEPVNTKPSHQTPKSSSAQPQSSPPNHPGPKPPPSHPTQSRPPGYPRNSKPPSHSTPTSTPIHATRDPPNNPSKGGPSKTRKPTRGKGKSKYEEILRSEWEKVCEISQSSESENEELPAQVDEKGSDFEVESENSYHSIHSDNANMSSESDSAYVEETYEKGNGEQELAVGAIFENISAFRDALRQHAVKNHFNCKYIHNEKTRVTVMCKESGCTWRLHASRLQDCITFQVKTLSGEHHCEAVNLVGNNMASSTWISNRIIEWIRDEPNLTVKSIRLRVRKMFAVEANYFKIYRAKAIAIEKLYGSSEEAFKKIPSLHAELVERNPGSVIKYETREDGTFHRFFMSFRACIDGFRAGCRPLLGLDGCHLKGKYEGVLLSATAMDGNFGLFPVAFAVVDSETGYQWGWFLELLKDAIGSGLKLTFMSDRAKGLIDSVDVVFPRHEHRFCMRHFYRNFKLKFPGKILEKILWQASRAYVPELCEAKLEELKKTNEQAYGWVISQGTKMWSRASFGEEAKCHYITNNISESCNNFVGDDRCKNYVDLLDSIRQKLMVKLDHRRRNANQWETSLVPKIKKYVQWVCKEASTAGVVYRSGDNEAEVDDGVFRSTVDLVARTCSCRLWQVSGMPCIHAAATILTLRRRVEDYVDDYFKVERYKATYNTGRIAAMPDKSLWKAVDVDVLPAYTNKKRGRPKKNRIRDADEPGTSGVVKPWKTCGRCGALGHNRRRCDAPVNPPPPAASTTTNLSQNSSAVSSRSGRGRGLRAKRGKDKHPFVRSTQ